MRAKKSLAHVLIARFDPLHWKKQTRTTGFHTSTVDNGRRSDTSSSVRNTLSYWPKVSLWFGRLALLKAVKVNSITSPRLTFGFRIVNSSVFEFHYVLWRQPRMRSCTCNLFLSDQLDLGAVGVCIGGYKYTDLVYADDVHFLPNQPRNCNLLWRSLRI